VSLAVFFADDLAPDRVRLTGAEGRHAAGAKRLRPGELVELVDGRGTRARCVVVDVARHEVVLEVQERVVEPRLEPRLTVVQAVPKGERGELAVELMTELGVDAVVPWSAARCIAQWKDERGDKALRRWQSTAREAAKQARRSWVTEVHALATTGEVVALLARADAALVLHESASAPLAALDLPQDGEVVLVVGPEGGLTDDELAAFGGAGAAAVRLGPTVLRTSSAGAAAAAVVAALTPRWA
jgi:16S rRNA (uracil1498-N3)-methyltransferase